MKIKNYVFPLHCNFNVCMIFFNFNLNGQSARSPSPFHSHKSSLYSARFWRGRGFQDVKTERIYYINTRKEELQFSKIKFMNLKSLIAKILPISLLNIVAYFLPAFVPPPHWRIQYSTFIWNSLTHKLYIFVECFFFFFLFISGDLI